MCPPTPPLSQAGGGFCTTAIPLTQITLKKQSPDASSTFDPYLRHFNLLCLTEQPQWAQSQTCPASILPQLIESKGRERLFSFPSHLCQTLFLHFKIHFIPLSYPHLTSAVCPPPPPPQKKSLTPNMMVFLVRQGWPKVEWMWNSGELRGEIVSMCTRERRAWDKDFLLFRNAEGFKKKPSLPLCWHGWETPRDGCEDIATVRETQEYYVQSPPTLTTQPYPNFDSWQPPTSPFSSFQ